MMNEKDICSAVNDLVSNCVIKQDKFLESQRDLLDQFYSRPYGNEQDGKSKVVTSEISDLVGSDMTSLARYFLGSNDVVEFIPNTERPEDVQEARDKQIYVKWVIDTAENSYRERHSMLKSAEIYNVAALKYGMEDKRTIQTRKFPMMGIDEVTLLKGELEDDPEVDDIKIIQDEDKELTIFKIKRTVQQPFIRNVPIDRLLITGNSTCKSTAPCIGETWEKTRGELLVDGYSKEDVMKLDRSDGQSSVIEDARFFDQGGTEQQKIIQQWASETVSGVDVYVLLDTENNGILERHHIIKSGDVILTDDVEDHVPYAIGSAELMPDNMIGRGRASLVQQHQKVNTFLTRGIINNIAKVNNPRTAVRKDPNKVSGVDMDDLLNDIEGGVIRTDGQPSQDIMPVTVPYIGDAIMQVQAGFDQKAAQTTGSQLANQALTADNLHKETATRFEGIQEAGLAKIELVARNLAETVWTDLYEGLAWLLKEFQDTDREIYVLGRQMVVNPANWQFDHKIRAVVGTGSGDDSKTLMNLSTILQLQRDAVTNQSRLSDEAKIYNTLEKITRAMGQHTPSEFFNDPEEPQEAMKAELDILRRQVEELATQLQQKNPLAEVEQIKNQDKEAQRQFDAAMKIKDEQLKKIQMQVDALQKQSEDSIKRTELELKYGQNVPGSDV